ncbi:hypothetical protein Hdeb2414_s0006g00188401 [Helianthus debilis subsp. tardiflorus]
MAVVGRTVNLETLVDFKKLLKIAKTDFTNLFYLGGLSIMISFSDESPATAFLESKNLWGPLFSKLDMWVGQSLPLERVAWLRILGIPLHLLVEDVLTQVGDLFGKVLHVPRILYGVQDLSVFSVGVLAGEAPRIREPVNLNWKNRVYIVWVEEEQEVWVPDCLGSVDGVPNDDSSSFRSEPDGWPESVAGVEVEKSSQRKTSEGNEETLKCGGSNSHIDTPMHEVNVNPVGGVFEDVVGSPKVTQGFHSSQPVVGPNRVVNNSGPVPFVIWSSFDRKFKRAQRCSFMGSKSSKGRAQSSNQVSPMELRPKKRSRVVEDEVEPGFGFIGFTSRAGSGSGDNSRGFERGDRVFLS